MADKSLGNETSTEAFTSEAARQRWELFHRAIAHAKKSNSAALEDSEDSAEGAEQNQRHLSTAG